MNFIIKKYPKCDVCGSKKFEVFRVIKDHTYHTCIVCETIVLSTRGLNSHEPNTYLDDPEEYVKIINPHGTRYIAGNVDHAYDQKVGKPKGSLLEIGSGTGFLSYTLFSRGWEVEQLELSQAAADWSSKVFKLPVSTEMIEDYTPGHLFEAVVMVEVLEHFYDPKKALKKIHSILAKKGLLFGTTPNTTSLHWKKSKQNIYEPSDHIVLFNPKSLKKVLEDSGFTNVTVEPFGVGDKNDSNLMYSAVKK